MGKRSTSVWLEKLLSMLGSDFPVWLLCVHTPVRNPHSSSVGKPDNSLVPGGVWGGSRNHGLSLGP